jgi:acetyl esterase/lipase
MSTACHRSWHGWVTRGPEVLELDPTELAPRLAASGVPATLENWQGQGHDFHLIRLEAGPEAR